MKLRHLVYLGWWVDPFVKPFGYESVIRSNWPNPLTLKSFRLRRIASP